LLRSWPCYALAALIPVLIMQPFGSRDAPWTRGWLGITSAVAQAYQTLPDTERRNAVIVGDTYTQAAALDQFGPAYGLPEVYSPKPGLLVLRPASGQCRTDRVHRPRRHDHRSLLRQRPGKSARIDMPGGMRGINLGVSIWICTDQKVSVVGDLAVGTGFQHRRPNPAKLPARLRVTLTAFSPQDRVCTRKG